MKNRIVVPLILIILSAVVYYIHFLIFRDAHHIFLYLVSDIAFVFLEVLLVSLIIEKILHDREMKEKMSKLNMVIGAFYSETGGKLLAEFSELDKHFTDKQEELRNVSGPETFGRFTEIVKKSQFIVDISRLHWEGLKKLLISKREFMVRMLENPLLLEHEKFSDLLWAVFHLTEELEARDSLEGLPKEDYQHLAGDVHRAYGSMALQWVKYMEHLQTDYPHLFSLALRINPFDRKASAIVND